MFNLTQKDIDDMWHWYALPAIILSFLIFNIAVCCAPMNGRHEIEPTIQGVDRAEIVSRWDQ